MALSEAFVGVSMRRGARSPSEISDRMGYPSRRGRLPFYLPERDPVSIRLTPAEYRREAKCWALQSGYWDPGLPDGKSSKDLTTHMYACLPPGTDRKVAEKIAIEWAYDMFRTRKPWGDFFYYGFVHEDKPHPHVHFLINRRDINDPRNKFRIVSRSNYRQDKRPGAKPPLFIEDLRTHFVTVAKKYGILLTATSRKERGIMEPAPSKVAYRRMMREREIEALRAQGLVPQQKGQGGSGGGVDMRPDDRKRGRRTDRDDTDRHKTGRSE